MRLEISDERWESGDGIAGASPVKVSLLVKPKDTDVIGKDRWEFMQKFKVQGQTLSQNAHLTGVDRKTIRACLALSQR